MKTLLAVLLSLTFLSCKKEPVQNTHELLTRSWEMTAWDILTPFEGTPLEGQPTNWMGANDYFSGRIQHFKPNGIFLHEAAAICINDLDFNGTWSLSERNRVINVKYTGGGFSDFNYKIIELTPFNLKVQRVERTGVGGSQIMDLLVEYEFEPK